MDASAKILEGLDEDQRQAATTVQGPVRIIAGAGAGKTRTVTRRIAYACASGQWDGNRTLAVTFSVKAAAEMRGRLEKINSGISARVSTFHAAALRQLRTVWPDISDAPFPVVLRDAESCMERAVGRVFAAGDGMEGPQVRDVLAEINWCKVSLIAPEDYPRVCSALHRQPPAGLEPQRFGDVYEAYEREKTGRGEIDFNDILLMACHVLDDFEEAAASIRSSIGWLTVDEYQDVSPLQHRLMRLWLDGNRNVCVVGDPAQTIYSFAGASSYDLLGFADEFAPVAADITLAVDYRSTPQVVRCANAVLGKSPDRADYLRLRAVREAGPQVSRTVFDHDLQEARAVAEWIAKGRFSGVSPSDCAVLVRVNAQQSTVCAALREAGLRYRIRSESGWRGSVVQEDEAERQAALESLGAQAATAVTVSTIHASKGLEFRHVFIVGCCEGLLPFGSPMPGDALEEERRLMYVGITRACDSLHLSFARSKDEGGRATREASRFLG